MGDGLLLEFQSVVDAVPCAIDIQHTKSKEAVSDGRYLTYRIAINLGDVILEGDDIYGDGVNVAARFALRT
jgi:class 3 adenylate cyclase